MENEEDKKKVVKLTISQAKEEDEDNIECYEIDPIDFTLKPTLSTSNEDEISIISEKGNFALMDYPHPRHLCGNFPFSRTAHEVYCSKCYCYVCEVAAPCVEW